MLPVDRSVVALLVAPLLLRRFGIDSQQGDAAIRQRRIPGDARLPIGQALRLAAGGVDAVELGGLAFGAVREKVERAAVVAPAGEGVLRLTGGELAGEGPRASQPDRADAVLVTAAQGPDNVRNQPAIRADGGVFGVAPPGDQFRREFRCAVALLHCASPGCPTITAGALSQAGARQGTSERQADRGASASRADARTRQRRRLAP